MFICTGTPIVVSTPNTSSNSTQTGTASQANTSGTQTSNATNTSGTQTGPRPANVNVRNLPAGSIPGGIPGLQQMLGMPGGQQPGGPRPVDPYLQCSSRHFLRHRVRHMANQPAAPNAQVWNV